jgi:hypothetical protein
MRRVDKNRPSSPRSKDGNSPKAVVNEARVERVFIIPSDSADNTGAAPTPTSLPANVEAHRRLPPGWHIFCDCRRWAPIARTQYQVHAFNGLDPNIVPVAHASAIVQGVCVEGVPEWADKLRVKDPQPMWVAELSLVVWLLLHEFPFRGT